MPQLNQLGRYQKTSIDGILGGLLIVDAKNHGEMIPLGGPAGANLVQQINQAPLPNLQDATFQFIKERYEENSQNPKGKFSLANKVLSNAIDDYENLHRQLKDLKIDTTTSLSEEAANILLLKDLFKSKVARTAIINMTSPVDFSVDAHANADNPTQPSLYALVAEKIGETIRLLRETPFDENRSMYDVTTFMVGSEFSRTMRSSFSKFEESGTDHNPLSNSLIVGGKKVKGGQVIGQSDFRSSSEVLSGTHQSLDSAKNKVMGRPFDFKTMKPSGALPTAFDVDDYISMPNVTNTLFKAFGVDSKNHWVTGNNKPPAPTIDGLLR
ncbi:MAG: DUF1501 domain-containing protein [Pseudomonadota bacterium]